MRIQRRFGASSSLTFNPVEPLRDSRLLREGGFRIYDGLVREPFLQYMLSESIARYPDASRTEVATSDLEEVRGGSPARRLYSAPGGAAMTAFQQTPGLTQFLAAECGVQLRLDGAGTYSYYSEPGDHLAIHRDVRACDVALVTCLADSYPCPPSAGARGGAMMLYPERTAEPLSRVRATPEEGALQLWLAPGHTIVLLGGVVPHAIVPVRVGQQRIVSIQCYEIVPSTSA